MVQHLMFPHPGQGSLPAPGSGRYRGDECDFTRHSDVGEWVHIPARSSDLTNLMPNLAFDTTTHSLSQCERQETGSLTLKV